MCVCVCSCAFAGACVCVYASRDVSIDVLFVFAKYVCNGEGGFVVGGWVVGSKLDESLRRLGQG